jgi:glycosyltransferase involved in cell wall biosynthesis
MKILMLAPEPFLEPRGTPFSVYNRIKALGKLGHEVDLIVYHIGKNVNVNNVNIYRIPSVPFVKRIAIGPSLTKIPLDALLSLKALLMILNKKYDCIHVHEEAALAGVFLKKIFKVPLIYDMHSSIPQQLVNFNFTSNKILIKLANFGEKFIIKNSDAIIAICPHLGESVKLIDPNKKLWIIENTTVSECNCNISEEKTRELRNNLGALNKKIILYTGTFEPYQGIDLLIKTIPIVINEITDMIYILVGGEDKQIREMEQMAEKLGIKDYVVFTGQRPVEEMPLFMEIADILVSPRVTGTNTPLKIYSYLKSGKPIIATNLLTHTQVLNEEIAVLTEPNPDDFAVGLLRILTNKKLGENIGKKAKELAEIKYSSSAFISKTEDLYDYIGSLRSA